MRKLSLFLVVVLSCSLILVAAPVRDRRAEPPPPVGASQSLTTQIYGPTPYRSFADSPFYSTTFGTFYLEDFEDRLLNVPGVTIDKGIVTSTRWAGFPNIDSVDADDGYVDNVCNGCDSWWYAPGSAGLFIRFATDGALPTHVGVVWTDGMGVTTFEAFDRNNVSLGVVGPVPLGDDTSDTAFGEDRFFGVKHDGGISHVFIANSIGGIEIDHLQFGFQEVCEDADGDGFGVDNLAVCPGGEELDCNDSNERISPAEPELYDGIDNNCNMEIDEGLDDDGDGIPNFKDECSNTRPGAGVTPDGCPRCGGGGNGSDDGGDDGGDDDGDENDQG